MVLNNSNNKSLKNMENPFAIVIDVIWLKSLRILYKDIDDVYPIKKIMEFILTLEVKNSSSLLYNDLLENVILEILDNIDNEEKVEDIDISRLSQVIDFITATIYISLSNKLYNTEDDYVFSFWVDPMTIMMVKDYAKDYRLVEVLRKKIIEQL